MIYIGIDPGAKGGVALIDGDGITVYPWDKASFLGAMRGVNLAYLARKDYAICCLEHVGPMPGQGVTSMFHFGENFGYIKGVLEANKIPYELVRPQKWKKEFSVTSDKNTSIEVCQRLFPDVSLLATPRSRKPHDGMSEALLMAEYARRHFVG